VARRQRLSETQIAELFDPPAEQRELVRHFTLSFADIAGFYIVEATAIVSAMRLCFVIFVVLAATCASVRGRLRLCSLSWPSRSGVFRSR
jgi:hypothetical protein